VPLTTVIPPYPNKCPFRCTIAELRKRKNLRHDKELASTLAPLMCHTQWHFSAGKETGSWLTIMPSLINGMELSAQEFRDRLLIRYAR
jgi:hypothetical protein